MQSVEFGEKTQEKIEQKSPTWERPNYPLCNVHLAFVIFFLSFFDPTFLVPFLSFFDTFHSFFSLFWIIVTKKKCNGPVPIM